MNEDDKGFLFATDAHGLMLTYWPADEGRPKNVNHASRVIISLSVLIIALNKFIIFPTAMVNLF
jgi:hypothetical protein